MTPDVKGWGESHQTSMEFRNNNLNGWFREDHIVTTVPEPAEYLLLACGIALLGFFAVHRRTNQYLEAS
jgi:hypothetical protein